MKIKEGCDVSTSEFWYDLCNGYIKPEELLENSEDVKRVQAAVETIREFENSCDEQIDGFTQ
jgi:hypothetical protein